MSFVIVMIGASSFDEELHDVGHRCVCCCFLVFADVSEDVNGVGCAVKGSTASFGCDMREFANDDATGSARPAANAKKKTGNIADECALGASALCRRARLCFYRPDRCGPRDTS